MNVVDGVLHYPSVWYILRMFLIPFFVLAGCALISDQAFLDRMDLDGDGIPRPTDCDDDDAAIGAADGLYVDADGDGFGGTAPATTCALGDGVSATGGDCDDVDPLTFPGATEVCNGVDDDCDTVADDGVAPPTWYFDGDGDGYGTPNTTDVGCTATEGYVASGADCNDADPAINPDTLWYPDLDEDGYGDMNSPVASCDQPAGLIRDGTDCDDARGDVSPAGLEVCDAGCTDAGCDEDCDGLVDDEDSSATGQTVWYLDEDGDELGTAVGASEPWCDAPSGYVDNWKDCDDDRVDGADSTCVDYSTVWGSEMVMIPSGTFVMGGGADDWSNSYRDHEVSLTHDFWIGKTELTQGAWVWFTDATDTTPSHFPMCGSDCPVETVEWYDAARYANALSTAEGLTPCYLSDGTDLAEAYLTDPYVCSGYRLPTEAEWEYAARAGVDTVYAGSDTAADVAWTSGNSGETTHSACGLAANAWGLCDMSGNVREWVSDWYDDRYGGYGDGVPSSDPSGPVIDSDGIRCNRGGDFYNDSNYAYVSRRFQDPPSYDVSLIGFRLARTIP